MTDLSIVRESHLVMDQVLEEVFRRERARGKNYKVPCRRGCSACCHEPLYGEFGEAELAIHLLAALPEAQRRRVHDKVIENVSKLKASGMLEIDMPNAFSYRKLRLACPFLYQDECLIYDDRPSDCRAHIALGEAEGCVDLEKRRNQLFMMNHELMGPAMTVLQRQGSIIMDHFVLHLFQLLEGEKVPGAGRMEITFNGDDAEVRLWEADGAEAAS